MLLLERRGIPFNFVLTGQHQETMQQLLCDFNIRTQPKVLHRGREITSLLQMGCWFFNSLFRLLRPGSPYLPRTSRQRDIVVVHGDTVSTLLGALAGRLKGMSVAHVEAGLRSFNLLHPFPEELTRLAVFRLSDLAFCPGKWACSNMASQSTQVIDTGHNTLRDALHIALDVAGQAKHGDFGVISIHRFENIFGKKRLSSILDMVEHASRQSPLVFVLHPTTRKKLTRFGLMAHLEGNPRIELRPRMGYIEFVRLLQQASFVITDGGGNQEELSYLGVPTLLMRKSTERLEGLDSTAVICGYDQDVLANFLAHLPDRARPEPVTPMFPSQMIVDALAKYVD